jgi:hypothetical protein
LRAGYVPFPTEVYFTAAGNRTPLEPAVNATAVGKPFMKRAAFVNAAVG